MRQLGLDIFRSVAIFLVVIAHLEPVFSKYVDKGTILSPLGQLGQWGVDFFFALSGFLIGRILIRSLIKYKNYQWIPNFLYRRWLKTLPLYYLVLFAYGFIYGFKPDFMLYFFHIKGLVSWTSPILYGASWSLFVEEFFYLSCALCAFSFYYNKTAVSALPLLKFCFLIIFISVSFRLFFSLFIEHKHNILNITLARLDAPIFGFMLAIAKEYYPVFFHQMEKNRDKFIFIGFITILFAVIHSPIASLIMPYTFLFAFTATLGGFFVYFACNKSPLASKVTLVNKKYKKPLFYLASLTIALYLFNAFFSFYVIYFQSTWSFSIAGLSSCMLLLYFATMPELNLSKRLSSTVLFFSQSSYAVYLTHELLIKFCFSFIKDTPRALELKYCLLTTASSLLLIYLLGYLLIKFIEQPILAWRDRTFIL